MRGYKGKYKAKNPQKYRGDHTNIIFRSLLERAFMVYLDMNESILEWSSEETIIPYKSPIDNQMHRYFPDFRIKIIDRNDNIQTILIEVKPKSQTTPPKEPKRKTPSYVNAVSTYLVNEAKWNAAKAWCSKNNAEFKILTEEHIKGYSNPYKRK